MTFRGNYTTIEKVDVVDERTVNITTTAPDILLPARMAGFGANIVPPVHTAAVGSAGLTNEPIGTGPYKFVEWVKDDRVELVANDDYWGGRPEIDRVIFKPIPDVSVRIGALQKGEVDVAYGIPPDLAPSLESSGGARVVWTPSAVTFGLGIDQSVPPLDNQLVRQAMWLAIDRESICKNIYLGYCEASHGGIGSKDFGFDPNTPVAEYNPEKAKELLTQAGYAGEPIKLFTTSGNWLKDKELMEVVQGYLQAVGLNVNLEVVETSTYYEMHSTHTRPSGGVYLWGFSSTLLDPDGIWWRFLQPTGIANYGWENEEWNSEMQRARSIVDQTEREEIYRQQITELFPVEVPVVPMLYGPVMVGVGPKVTSFLPRADNKIYLLDIQVE
jgi:peptide/nickel transport system substrate-binding protein